MLFFLPQRLRGFFVIIFFFSFALARGENSALEEGLILEAKGDYELAKNAYQLAKESLQGSDLSANLALGRIYNLLTEYDSAINYLNIIIEEKEKVDPALFFQASLERGFSATETDQYEAAESYFNQVDRTDLSLLLQLKSDIITGYHYTKTHQFPKALSILEKAEAEMNDLEGNVLTKAKIIFHLGYYYQVKRQYQKSLEYYEKAILMMEETFQDTHPFLARILNMAGQSYRALGDAEKGRQYSLRAHEIQKKELPKNHLEFARTYLYLGIFSYLRNDNTKAVDFYNLALRIRRDRLGKRHRSVAALYNNLGIVHWREKDFEEGLTAFSQSVSIYEEILGPENLGIAGGLNNMGLCYAGLKNYENALIQYQKARDIRIKHQGKNHSSLIGIYNNMGLSYREMKQFDLALRFHKRALEMISDQISPFHPRAAKHCNNIALVYLDRGQPEEAMQWHQEAFRRIDPDFSPASDCENPDLQKLRLTPVVLEIFQFKAQTMKALGEKGQMPDYRQCMLESFQLASDFIDSMRVSYLAEDSKFKLAIRTAKLFEGAIDICWDLYQETEDFAYLETAFGFNEKQKSVILLESIRSGNLKKFGGVDPKVLAAESRIKQNMAEARENMFYEKRKGKEADNDLLETYSDQFFKSWLEYDSLMAVLNQLYPDYVNLKYTAQSPAITQVQKQISGDNIGLIEYFLGNESLYTFYIGKDELKWFHQDIKGDSLKEMIDDFRQSISSPFLMASGSDSVLIEWGSNYIDYGVGLYQLLFSPLDNISTTLPERLTIVPDGLLSYLPFDALLTERPDREGYYRTYPYLVKKHSLSLQFSAALLNLQGEKESVRKVNNGIGFSPEFGIENSEGLRGSNLQPLPFGKIEVEQIAKLINLNTFFDKEASIKSFHDHAPEADLIHISSHAKVNDKKPKFSAIYFSGGDSLLILDLFSLNLKAKLVTLSACETGVGKFNQGEGMMSLARGFAYAGAESIINSLWQVNDEATASIITSFYKKLKSGESKDKALRTAKLDYLENSDNLTSHPYYWAGQIAIGNMEELSFASSGLLFWGIGVLLMLVIAVVFLRRRMV